MAEDTTKVHAESEGGKAPVYKRLVDSYAGAELVNVLERAQRGKHPLYVLRERVTDIGRDQESALFARPGMIWMLVSSTDATRAQSVNVAGIEFDFARLDRFERDLRLLTRPEATIEAKGFVVDLPMPVERRGKTWDRLVHGGNVSLTRDDLWVRVEDAEEAPRPQRKLKPWIAEHREEIDRLVREDRRCVKDGRVNLAALARILEVQRTPKTIAKDLVVIRDELQALITS